MGHEIFYDTHVLVFIEINQPTNLIKLYILCGSRQRRILLPYTSGSRDISTNGWTDSFQNYTGSNDRSSDGRFPMEKYVEVGG